MTALESETTQHPNSSPSASGEEAKPARQRSSDGGPELLPDMQHFVFLARKIKRQHLLKTLLDRCHNSAMAEFAELFEGTPSVMPPAARKILFEGVAAWPGGTRHALERAAERIQLLDDEYGVQAVRSLLYQTCSDDAAILAAPTDKHSRALYLYLRQEFPATGAIPEHRFDQAERLQIVHRQWKSERYSSHFQGPKGVVPKLDAATEEALKDRIVTIYPMVARDDILIGHFTRRDLSHADRCLGLEADEAAPVDLHTVIVTFNGAETHYTKVVHGEEVGYDDWAALSIVFSSEPASGALSVFSEDKASRVELAKIFRDVVLAESGEIAGMPIRKFDLSALASHTILQRLAAERVEGVESISILHLKVGKPFKQSASVEAEGREVIQHLASHLKVFRDRRDQRNIYTVAYEDYALHDLSVFKLEQVKLAIRIAKQPYRNAHNVTVQITDPNGFNDSSKTEDDRKRVMAQLIRLGIAQEF